MNAQSPVPDLPLQDAFANPLCHELGARGLISKYR